MLSLGVHSNSISLKISLCKLSALFWLSFGSRTKIYSVSISVMSSPSASLPSQVLAMDSMDSFSEPKSLHWH